MCSVQHIYNSNMHVYTIQIKRETLHILDDGKYSQDFDGARKNLDTLTIQIQIGK